MVKLLLLLPLVYLAAVAETALVDVLRVGSVAPDVLALVAVVWLVTAPGRYVFLAAAAVTLVGDLIGPGRVGIGTAWMLLLGYAVCRLQAARFPHYLVQTPVVLAVVAIWVACVGTTERLVGGISLPFSTILLRSLGTGLFTAGVALPILMVLTWIRERGGRRGTAGVA